MDKTVQLYPLTFVPDKPDVVVGRVDIDSFAVFPEDGAELLKRLQEGLSPDEAARWYEQQYGETLDIADFLETLHDLQFIREKEEVSKAGITRQSSDRIWECAGRAAFSFPAWVIYSCLFGYAIFLIIRFPFLRPLPSTVFFSPYYTVIELGLFFGQFPGLFLHELYHMLAGKRLGLRSRLGVGHRLYFIVFETHLTGLWSVPRKKRYLPYLAGMICDVIWCSLLVVLASLTYTPTNPYSFPGAFLLALAFSTILRFIWQFYFYLQTDVYYVITNALHCVDLQQTTRALLKNIFFRLLRRPEKQQNPEEWHPNDRRIAPWYAPLLFTGYAINICVFLFALIPIAIRYLGGVAARLFLGTALGKDFIDACIFLGLNFLQLLIILVIIIRNHRAKRRRTATARWIPETASHEEIKASTE
jgi:hypothetical protein